MVSSRARADFLAMAALSFLTRNQRHGVVWNTTDHQLQLARIVRLDEKPVILDRFAELPLNDDEAASRWLRESFPDRGPSYLAGYCGFHPTERVLLRDVINTRRLTEPNFLESLLAEHA